MPSLYACPFVARCCALSVVTSFYVVELFLLVACVVLLFLRFVCVLCLIVVSFCYEFTSMCCLLYGCSRLYFDIVLCLYCSLFFFVLLNESVVLIVFVALRW